MKTLVIKVTALHHSGRDIHYEYNVSSGDLENLEASEIYEIFETSLEIIEKTFNDRNIDGYLTIGIRVFKINSFDTFEIEYILNGVPLKKVLK